MREIKLKSGELCYDIQDKQGFLQFFPSGIFENSNCVNYSRLTPYEC